MQELVLAYSVHGGLTRGSTLEAAVIQQAARIEQGLPPGVSAPTGGDPAASGGDPAVARAGGFLAEMLSERSQRGVDVAAGVFFPLSDVPKTAVDAAWRDFVFAEVWSRPGLDQRSRFITAIVGTADMAGPSQQQILDSYVRGSLKTGNLTVTELREVALQMTAYSGFVGAETLDRSVTRVVAELGLEEPPFRPLQNGLTDEERIALGRASFEAANEMSSAALRPLDPFITEGVVGYAFAELWSRPELSRRDRRIITLVTIADTQAPGAVTPHAYWAMSTGDLTKAEMQELVLAYSVHGGLTRGSTLEAAVIQQAARIEQGLPPG
jgi:4-carboxymuconolactone decarboxylase